MTSLRELYNFADIELTRDVKEFMKTLINGSQGVDGNQYGIIRSSSFDINHWSIEMQESKIKQIEKICRNFMIVMNYSFKFYK